MFDPQTVAPPGAKIKVIGVVAAAATPSTR